MTQDHFLNIGQEPKDEFMLTFNPSHQANREPSIALSLFFGVPILCTLMALFAYIFWAIHGFPSELAPRHWLDDYGLLVFAMSFFGGVMVLLATGFLWILGVIAMAFGEGAVTAWRRLRRAA